MWRTSRRVIIFLFAAVSIPGTAWSFTPSCVEIDGSRRSDEQSWAISQLHGVPLACGSYWFVPRTGLWGLEGGPPLGRFGDGSRINPDGGYHYSGPGGYSGSDGDTSYYDDPGTGCSVIPGEGVSC
ncbi:MAG: hypothetical protein D6690_05985 [Nitrospirae bacterium]|nr:MAG: hypothetical protein D6690_05985 [Nitrospirota bacterium]